MSGNLDLRGAPSTLAIALALILALSIFASDVSPARAQEGQTDGPVSTPEGTVSTTEDRVEITPGADDSAIAERLENILDATGWFAAIDVRVEDGVVFLNGTAASAENSEWAQRLATRTDGVVAVVNQVDVRKVVNWTMEPALNEIRRLANNAIAAAPLILLSLLILPLTFFAASLVARVMRWSMKNSVESPFLRDVIARLVAFPVFLIGLYVVLQVAGLTQLALSLLGGAGVVGIVIGFAFRDIAENFLASILLSTRKPFRAGDLITVSDTTGIVQSMNTRSTVLITPEGNHFQIPNAVVFKNTIENHTAAPYRRDSFVVGIGYDDTTADVQALILDILVGHEKVAADPPPLALLDQLGDSTVNLRAYYWFDGQRTSHIKLKSALMRQVKRVLLEAGVSMPDAAREVIFPKGVPVVQASGEGKKLPSTRTLPPRPAAEPEVAASDEDLSADTDLLERQASPRIEEGDADLLDD